MINTSSENEAKRQTLLEGISQNLNYTEIAAQLGVRRGDLLRDLRAMRHSRDTGLRDAQRTAQAQVSAEKQVVSIRRDERFHAMTGMTLQEKTFQNMVHYYKAEITAILRSSDPENAIRRLPQSTRRTLMHNGILTKRNRPQITAQARSQIV
ncbi:hypothetical protein A3K81_02710 [Candidatus Bathyarchaeota archaeon RBG_13_60_20]|jgi:hypothetical protein|nr:MAG: hypothetical protein A3K81_02710 [Candidatus Bathyarchaeota archaeon RBG_13_60_20]